jgi:hypothetical protein
MNIRESHKRTTYLCVSIALSYQAARGYEKMLAGLVAMKNRLSMPNSQR